jgi:hypothetical protein
MVTVDNRSAHHDEHLVPARVVESRLAAFEAGRDPFGAVFNRTGATGGTEVSEDAHNVAGAKRAAAELAESGHV